jgi:hypothetical protein
MYKNNFAQVLRSKELIMTALVINDLPVGKDLDRAAMASISGGRMKLGVQKPTVPADPYGGAGDWNPYDGNLLNHPGDDG